MKRFGLLAGLALAGTTALIPVAMAQSVAPLAYVQTVAPTGLQSVQQRLHDLGFYAGASDGVWGRDSQNALVRFQQNKGLQITGNLNQSTLATLGLSPAATLGLPMAPVATTPVAPVAAVAPTAVVPVGADTIRLVQGRLQQLSFVSTPADGVWGPSTQEGIERLQRSRGLPVTGQLDAPVMMAMGLDPSALTQGH